MMKPGQFSRIRPLWWVFLACVIFFSPAPVWGADVVLVNTEILNIRSGPAITYECIGQVKSGEQLDLQEEKNGWLKIKLKDGAFGWVIRDYVALKPRELEINSDIVNIRSGPGTNFSKIASLSRGTKVTAVDFQQDWYKIKYSSGSGWVANWLVQAAGGLADSPPTPSSTETEISLKPEAAKETKASGSSEQQGISWDWEKTSSGVKIAIQGTEPLGYTEKIIAGEPKILMEFTGLWQSPLGVENINYGGIEEIRTEQAGQGVLFEVGLDEEVPYQTAVSQDGCLLTLNLVSEKKEGKTVVIDPGHGCYSAKGYDPGAVGAGGQHESDIVLDIGRRVEKLLTEKGIHVIMTRSEKTERPDLTLEDRACIANEASADVFVSIHANSSVSSTLNGTSTYFYAPSGSELEAQRGVRKYLAESIQNKLLQTLGRNNLGVREENFAVLRYTKVPSVLVETAFLSNPEEEKLLADDQFREQAAQAIAEGIWEYLNR